MVWSFYITSSSFPCHAQCDPELYSYLPEQSGPELLHYLFIFPLPTPVRRRAVQLPARTEWSLSLFISSPTLFPCHPQCDAELYSYLQQQSGPELLIYLSIFPCHPQCDAELYRYLQGLHEPALEVPYFALRWVHTPAAACCPLGLRPRHKGLAAQTEVQRATPGPEGMGSLAAAHCTILSLAWTQPAGKIPRSVEILLDSLKPPQLPPSDRSWYMTWFTHDLPGLCHFCC